MSDKDYENRLKDADRIIANQDETIDNQNRLLSIQKEVIEIQSTILTNYEAFRGILETKLGDMVGELKEEAAQKGRGS
jgi:uncharacterized coiled-coil protein SlyX